ncbi:hypothetical protein QEZ48_08380 [Aquamicrobium lusatiense]|uniref:hypothetical protein n=1 Tax=Aquamicrobium lusatiense TaxID=89772 RepID=UPI0024561FC6|nr:hypothetical protein [Aquamicrobium lusatiense]MDH4990846.1 hypothetical protein [Aquamicrobium lusatiense]
MSRGPGKIERAVEALLNANPRRTFTGEEMALACYPGLNRVEKKHKVSVLRAANKVADRLRWASDRVWNSNSSIIFFNPLDLRSFAVGKTRAHEAGETIITKKEYEDTESRKKVNVYRRALGVREVAEVRTLARSEVLDEDRAIAMLLGEDTGTYWKGKRDKSRYIRTDGPYPLAVEAYRMEVNGRDASAVWEEYNKRVKIAVYTPYAIVGDIHPDFF